MTIMQSTQEGADVARTKTPTLTMFNQGRNEVLQIPTTHEEIINACTDAQKIYKNSHPPLLNTDGSLPPLP